MDCHRPSQIINGGPLRDLTFIIGGGGWVESSGAYENYLRYGGGVRKVLQSNRGVYEKYKDCPNVVQSEARKNDEIEEGSVKNFH